jgi:hypothetical protein
MIKTVPVVNVSAYVAGTAVFLRYFFHLPGVGENNILQYIELPDSGTGQNDMDYL